MREKQVQITETLFKHLITYHLLDDKHSENDIKEALDKKLEMMVRHELYTRYKTEADPEQQEKARQQYLKKIGMKEEFTW